MSPGSRARGSRVFCSSGVLAVAEKVSLGRQLGICGVQLGFCFDVFDVCIADFGQELIEGVNFANLLIDGFSVHFEEQGGVMKAESFAGALEDVEFQTLDIDFDEVGNGELVLSDVLVEGDDGDLLPLGVGILLQLGLPDGIEAGTAGHEGIEQHGEATGLATDSNGAMGDIGEAVEGHVFAKASISGGVRLIADNLLGVPGKEAGE